MYGSGLRVMECLRLRVKDVDLDYRQILVRDGKGEKDRVTMLPEKLVDPVRAHLERVRALHARDLRGGYGEVHLPSRLRVSIRARAASGHGSTSFLPRTARRIPTTASSGAIIWTSRSRSAR